MKIATLCSLFLLSLFLFLALLLQNFVLSPSSLYSDGSPAYKRMNITNTGIFKQIGPFLGIFMFTFSSVSPPV